MNPSFMNSLILHNIQTELQSMILIQLIHHLYKQVKELKTHDGEHLTTTQQFAFTSLNC